MPVIVDPSGSVNDIKNAIQDVEPSFSAEKSVLVLDRVVLSDLCRISDYSIIKSGVVFTSRIMDKSRRLQFNGMHVLCINRIGDGELVQLTVNTYTKISELKRMIASINDDTVAPGDIEMIFAFRTLEDHKTIKDSMI